MIRNRSRLENFVKRFIGAVKFENDHFRASMGYGDYTIGDSVISKYLSPKIYSENFAAEWRCRKTKSYSCGSYSDDDDIFKSSDVSIDLEKSKATTDIGIFVGYAPNRKGYRIYNKRTQRIMEIIYVQFDELSEPMAPVHISSRPEPILFMSGQISSGLVPNPVPATPYIPPTNKDLEILFQLMFDEYLEPLVLKDQYLLLLQFKFQLFQLKLAGLKLCKTKSKSLIDLKMIWINKVLWLTDVDFFVQLLIQKCSLDIHLVDGYVLAGGISNEDSDSLEPCNRCK
nr:integrase, catalytic region, zinc finger, CCHC-type, peptidase aspartic, catalytic [Tanacetum cinerariifolium]